jgi:chemotaxis protein MotA
MNPSTLIGLFTGLSILGSVFYWSADDPAMFLNLPGFGIVMGGTLAATFIAFPLNEVTRVFGLFWTVLKNEKMYVQNDIEELVSVSKTWMSGDLRKAEAHLEIIGNPFLKSGLQMVIEMTPHDDIMEFMSWRITRLQAKEQAEAQLFRVMSAFAPAFGMIGTLVGLINMMFILGSGDMVAIGHQLAVALMTTFYGVLLANLIFKPVAVKLERRTEERVMLMNMIMQGISLMSRKKSPIMMRETLNSFVASYSDEIWDGKQKPVIDPYYGNKVRS